ncbi:hypothetical protein [Bacteroides sp. 224]|uniref:hypothetical protein n=1 Tax=Bacteroides sp. 224 TaxID=2302936 RepID=UPI0013D03946|nr:hypothetical protein [Bacteroides sp. 224]NDV66452.1 hypothetical protein [Bacteroides sp. 224]
METEKTKIPFYVQRSFSDKINAAFDFIKENWKILLKTTTYLLLPVSLIQGIFTGSVMSMAGLLYNPAFQSQINRGVLPFDQEGFLINYVGLMLSSFVGQFLLLSLVYTLLKTYNEREEGLKGITLSNITSPLIGNIGRCLIMFLVSLLLYIGVALVLGLLAAVTPFTLILTIPALIVFSFPLLIWPATYLMEQNSVFGALSKSYRLGFATLGGVLAIYLVTAILASVVQGVFSTPLTVSTMVKNMFSQSDTVGDVSVGYKFMLYVLGVLQSFSGYLSAILVCLGLAYQYSHASEKVSRVSVESDIDNFENL